MTEQEIRAIVKQEVRNEAKKIRGYVSVKNCRELEEKTREFVRNVSVFTTPEKYVVLFCRYKDGVVLAREKGPTSQWQLSCYTSGRSIVTKIEPLLFSKGQMVVAQSLSKQDEEVIVMDRSKKNEYLKLFKGDKTGKGKNPIGRKGLVVVQCDQITILVDMEGNIIPTNTRPQIKHPVHRRFNEEDQEYILRIMPPQVSTTDEVGKELSAHYVTEVFNVRNKAEAIDVILSMRADGEEDFSRQIIREELDQHEKRIRKCYMHSD